MPQRLDTTLSQIEQRLDDSVESPSIDFAELVEVGELIEGVPDRTDCIAMILTTNGPKRGKHHISWRISDPGPL